MNSLGIDLLGKDVILHKERLKSSYWEIEFRVFRVTAGFGASPETMGTALFGEHLADGEKVRWEGNYVERLATDEEVRHALSLRKDAEMTELF